MPYKLLLFTLLSLLFACRPRLVSTGLPAQSGSQALHLCEGKDSILLGRGSQADIFAHADYAAWWRQYAAQAPRDSAAWQAWQQSQLAPDLRFELYLGTWCGDTRRQVPYWLRILESHPQWLDNQIDYIFLGRQKTWTDAQGRVYQAAKLPNLRVYEGSKLLAEILEYPPILPQSGQYMPFETWLWQEIGLKMSVD